MTLKRLAWDCAFSAPGSCYWEGLKHFLSAALIGCSRVLIELYLNCVSFACVLVVGLGSAWLSVICGYLGLNFGFFDTSFHSVDLRSAHFVRVLATFARVMVIFTCILAAFVWGFVARSLSIELLIIFYWSLSIDSCRDVLCWGIESILAAVYDIDRWSLVSDNT